MFIRGGFMFIMLHTVPHPDWWGGKSQPVYIRADHVILIEPTTHEQIKQDSLDRHRDAIEQLHEEVQRTTSEAGELAESMSMSPQNEAEARKVDRFVRAKEAAAALQAAYGMVAWAGKEVSRYPKVECTVISLACGTALEHGVMLSRIVVSESSETVRAILGEALGENKAQKGPQ